MYRLITELAHGTVNFCFRKIIFDNAPDAFHDFRIGDENTCLSRFGKAEMGANQLFFDVRLFKPLVVPVQFFHLILGKPITETVAVERQCLCVKSLIRDLIMVEVIYEVYKRRKPTAVAGIIGQEQAVIARGAERSDMGTEILVAVISGAFVDGGHGHHRLEAVQLVRTQVVDLLDADKGKLGKGEVIIFGHLPAIGFRIEITLQLGRKQFIEKCGLIDTLFTDKHQNSMVHHLLIQDAGHERHEPFTEMEGESGIIRSMHHRRHPGDIIGLPIPDGKVLHVGRQGIVPGYEFRLQDAQKSILTGIQIRFLRTEPKRIFFPVGDVMEVGFIQPAYLPTGEHDVITKAALRTDKRFQLPDRGVGQLTGVIFGQCLCTVFIGMQVHRAGDACESITIIVGKFLESPLERHFPCHSEIIHQVERGRDVIIVIAFGVAFTLLFEQCAHGNRRFVYGGMKGLPGSDGSREVLFLRNPNMHRHGSRVIVRVGIITKIARTGGILAMLVKGMTQQLFVVRFALPVHRIMIPDIGDIRQEEKPDAESGMGNVRQQHIGIEPQPLDNQPGHSRSEIIQIAHANARVTADMFYTATALADDGRGDKFRAPLDASRLRLLTMVKIITMLLGGVTVALGGNKSVHLPQRDSRGGRVFQTLEKTHLQ